MVVHAAKERNTHDVMVEYAYNSTSSVHAQSSTTSSINTVAAGTDPLIGVIIILTIVVVAALFFVICGLFLKAEAHLHAGRQSARDDLLVEPCETWLH